MAKIKVICGGCGIVYKDAAGNDRHALKTPESGPFECDDAQAERLVGLGVAQYVGHIWHQDAAETPAQQEETGEQTEETSEPEKVMGRLSAEDLESWDYNQLKKLAADMGVVPAGKKKADYIAAIVAVEVEIDVDDIVDDDPDNDLPDLTAAEPQ